MSVHITVQGRFCGVSVWISFSPVCTVDAEVEIKFCMRDEQRKKGTHSGFLVYIPEMRKRTYTVIDKIESNA